MTVPLVHNWPNKCLGNSINTVAAKIAAVISVVFLFSVPVLSVETIFYLSPDGAGKRNAESPKNAGDFHLHSFWKDVVQKKLADGPVTVRLLAGEYVIEYDCDKKIDTTLTISNTGHETNLLRIEGDKSGGSVIRRSPHDSLEQTSKNRPHLLTFVKVKNLEISNLNFRGKEPVGYVTRFRSCQNVVIKNCSWKNMTGVYYGATGAHYSDTDNITWKNCHFERIGYNSHAHMMYNSWKARNLRIIGNTFIDSKGDYVRFRDGVDHCLVDGNTFISSGDFGNAGDEYPFIAVPLFNDADPSTNPPQNQLEYFGTHFRICNNKFIYREADTPGRKFALVFHNSGWSPPGKDFSLDPESAEFLRTAPAEKRRKYFLQKMGIDFDTVVLYGNEEKNVGSTAVYEYWRGYGSPDTGFSGEVDISDLLNTNPDN